MTKRTNRIEEQAAKIIGMETTYIGHERRYGGHGAKVMITAIFRYDEDEESNDRHVLDNDHLALLGGVRPQDGAEIHTRHPTENRWCFVGDELESLRDIDLAGLKPARG